MDVASIIFVILFCLLYFFLGETIPVFNGRGWDGIGYTNIVQNFSLKYLLSLPRYDLGRLVPSTIIFIGMSVIHQPLTYANIILAFRIYDAIVLILGTFLWSKVIEEFHVSLTGQWLMVVGLLVNYCFLKMFFYYPVLTDQTAFVLGISQLLFYLKKKPAALLAVSILGAFTWPNFFLGSILLLAFPVQNNPNTLPRHRSKTAIFLAYCIVLMVIVGLIFFHYYVDSSIRIDLVPRIQSLFPVSVLSVLLIIFFGSVELFSYGNFNDHKKICQNFDKKWFSISLSTFLFLQVGIFLIGKEGTVTLYSTLRLFFQTSVIRPFNSLVAHFAYFGVFIVLAVLFWRKIAQIANQIGLGLSLFLVFYFVQFILICESRQLTPVFPLVIALTVKAMDDLNWGKMQFWVITLTAFIVSKIWMPINVEEFHGPLIEFPYQYYFMTQGPWMSNRMFVIYAGWMIVVAGLFYIFIFKNRRNSGTVAEQKSNE